ncbi:hypothetical protein Bhyg_05357 [Pseudolycoriella hygida]|uniref:Uncharacterized protein n=1 Tax=Pseudolycoriella hygida TaxID=35572 RepID=A0A9Q0NH99_9DIPT|nr:hypothetical protein Bhyg_05357 [Pseudolycoriella hygida]
MYIFFTTKRKIRSQCLVISATNSGKIFQEGQPLALQTPPPARLELMPLSLNSFCNGMNQFWGLSIGNGNSRLEVEVSIRQFNEMPTSAITILKFCLHFKQHQHNNTLRLCFLRTIPQTSGLLCLLFHNTTGGFSVSNCAEFTKTSDKMYLSSDPQTVTRIDLFSSCVKLNWRKGHIVRFFGSVDESGKPSRASREALVLMNRIGRLCKELENFCILFPFSSYLVYAVVNKYYHEFKLDEVTKVRLFLPHEQIACQMSSFLPNLSTLTNLYLSCTFRRLFATYLFILNNKLDVQGLQSDKVHLLSRVFKIKHSPTYLRFVFYMPNMS